MFNFLSNLINNPLNPASGWQVQDFGDLLGLVINVFLGIGIAVPMVTLGVCSIQIIVSGTDIKATDKSRKCATYSIIALILVALAVSAKYAVLNTLSVSGDFLNDVPSF